MKYQFIKPEVIHASMMNDREMTRQFVEMYLIQCPMDFERLESSISQKDQIAIGHASHHIKPTMAYIGANELHLDFQELEDLARKQDDFDLIINKFNHLKQRFEALLSELSAFLREM
jgi:HPt (histidine-containing phosphotransfer) domain-containing protein